MDSFQSYNVPMRAPSLDLADARTVVSLGDIFVPGPTEPQQYGESHLSHNVGGAGGSGPVPDALAARQPSPVITSIFADQAGGQSSQPTLPAVPAPSQPAAGPSTGPWGLSEYGIVPFQCHSITIQTLVQQGCHLVSALMAVTALVPGNLDCTLVGTFPVFAFMIVCSGVIC